MNDNNSAEQPSLTQRIAWRLSRVLANLHDHGPHEHPAPSDPWKHLRRNVLEVRDFVCLKKAMGWTADPVLTDEHLGRFDYLEDLNERRLRDAEVIAGACCNGAPRTLLEIGTANGQTTALMARHAPAATVHTVNIPPEEIHEGGRLVTGAFAAGDLGRVYREQGCTNVRQILANTATWEPDLGPVDVALIDGCHDAEFVFNDTRKILKTCRPGSIILWHDFNLDVMAAYPWIAEVCHGVDRLYAERLIKGRILHVRDSWIGLYRV